MNVDVPASLGSADPGLVASFLTDHSVFRATSSPPLIQRRIIRSCAWLSCRDFGFHLPPELPPSAPTLGFLPSSRAQSSESTCDGRTQPPPTFRPRGFAPPRRFPPPQTLPACFIRLPRPGFSLQGFPPTGQVKAARRRPHPSSSLASGSCQLALAPAPGASTSRCCPVR